MGRATELTHYLNLRYEPSGDDKMVFHSLSITPELKAERKRWVKARKKEGYYER